MRVVARLLVLAMCMMLHYANAQEKTDVKFGKLSRQDFDLSKYNFDTSAGAVIVADMGSVDFEIMSNGRFTIYFRRQVRISILSNTGFEAANFAIPVYDDGKIEEQVEKLQAVTYNVEGGKIVESRMEDKAVFKDKINRRWSVKKFTLPAVKQGSIIEVSYTIKSNDIFNLRPWEFQGKYPRLWSEFFARIPACIDYVALTQGYYPFHIKTQEIGYKSYSTVISHGTSGNSTYSMKVNVTNNRWVMKDVPPIKEERFITSLNNYIAKIEFQLSQVREPFTPRTFLNNWPEFTKELLKWDEFGEVLSQSNSWLNAEMKTIAGEAAPKLEQAKKIYAYVRDNFTCTNLNDFRSKNDLQTVFKNKNGTVGEINLLLIAMLRQQEIDAEPVLLSTREHGITHAMHPLVDKFNYVIAGVTINNRTYFLDATEPRLGFGKLPLRCYNGHARFINNSSSDAVFFHPDSLREQRITSVLVKNEKGKLISTFSSRRGYYESLELRNKFSKNGKDEFLKQLKVSYPDDYAVYDLALDSIDNTEHPVYINYKIDHKGFNSDLIYFSPMFSEGWRDHYFKSPERFYPVEMPYTINELYEFEMEIPAGYVVDELPESGKMSLPGNEGSFVYTMDLTGNKIMLRSHVRLNAATFMPESYNSLRKFFSYIVKKHSESIVFKKK